MYVLKYRGKPNVRPSKQAHQQKAKKVDGRRGEMCFFSNRSNICWMDKHIVVPSFLCVNNSVVFAEVFFLSIIERGLLCHEWWHHYRTTGFRWSRCLEPDEALRGRAHERPRRSTARSTWGNRHNMCSSMAGSGGGGTANTS